MVLSRYALGYVFDPETLHDIVRDVVGPPIEEILPVLIERLADRWPKHIDRKQEWVLNNAGGAMGAMTFLHGSLSEYLIIFGSPIGTEGHTGRFLAHDYFYILDGEQWIYTPGDLRRRVYKPGDVNHLPKGQAGGYRIPDHCWALEYARGVIPSMMPFGFADMAISTLDARAIAQTLRIYAHKVTGQLLQGKI